MTSAEPVLTGERADLIETLDRHRFFLRYTCRDLTDEQAAARPTVSQLCLGGLVKHVTATERQWADFIRRGPEAIAGWGEAEIARHAAQFRMEPGESLAAILDEYERVARDTDALVASLPDLDLSHPLPEAPWFEPGARWSARRTLLHILAETSQHAGHADVIRESIDGAKTMG
jgi:uncharacterized damage-inducible protein DinB